MANEEAAAAKASVGAPALEQVVEVGDVLASHSTLDLEAELQRRKDLKRQSTRDLEAELQRRKGISAAFDNEASDALSGNKTVAVESLPTHTNIVILDQPTKAEDQWTVIPPVRSDVRQVEYELILSLPKQAPELRLFYGNRILAAYIIDPVSNNPDLTGKYLHSCLRILSNGGVMMDGIISNVFSSAKGFTEGLRFAPVMLDGSHASHNGNERRLKGQGLFARGLLFSGTKLPQDVRLIVLCDNPDCGNEFDGIGRSFTLQVFDAWNFGCQYFYSKDDSAETMTLPSQHLPKSMPSQASTSWPSGKSDWKLPSASAITELDSQLPGERGKFGLFNPLRCPHCRSPFIDFAAEPLRRKEEHYGCVYINQEPIDGRTLPPPETAASASSANVEGAKIVLSKPRPTPGRPVYASGKSGFDGPGDVDWMCDWRRRADQGPSYLVKYKAHSKTLRTHLSSGPYSIKADLNTIGNAVAFVKAGVKFPRPTGIRVNMMPFVISNSSKYTKTSPLTVDALPDELKYYAPLIEACPGYNDAHNKGKVAYLTVMETTAEEASGGPQRRGGMHTEGFLQEHAFGKLRTNHDTEPKKTATQTSTPSWADWGRGNPVGTFDGGIYMASNVANSTCVWNIMLPRETGGASRIGGDCEHLRPALDGTGMYLDAGEMVWMTDATPHESVPLPVGTARSYFRLVMPDVGVWWSKHSTPNPKGTVAPCEIREYDKFSGKTSD